MKIDKVELSALIVLFVGVGLLGFTFFSAYTFLVGILNIPGSQNLVQVFGQTFAPLIEAIIRILYLGIMGWIGSILTIRAVQLLKKEKTETASMPNPAVRTEDKQTVKPASSPEVKKTKPDVESPQKVKETEKVESPKNPEKVEKPAESTQVPPPPPAPPASSAPSS